MTHEKCADKIMEKTIKEFKAGKLKQKDKKVITDRKQAVAIGLAKVEDTCKYSKSEYKKLEAKVLEFVLSKPKDHIPLSRVIETKDLIKHYYNMKKYKKCRKYEILLMHYIITANNLEITKNIWSELKAIKRMPFKRF